VRYGVEVCGEGVEEDRRTDAGFARGWRPEFVGGVGVVHVVYETTPLISPEDEDAPVDHRF
jgi:hypothetical protein